MNIMKRIIKRRYNLVFSFDEMENIFKALNSLDIQSNIACGNCGWKDSDKWFVLFTATDYEMEKLFELIQFKTVMHNIDIPDGGIGIYLVRH